MSSFLLNLGERVASTFLFTFLAAAPTTVVAFNTSGLHAVEIAAATGGLAAGQSLVKNLLAFFTSQGNGPDAGLLAVSAPVAPAEQPVEAAPAPALPLDLGPDTPDDSDGSAVDA